LLSAWGGRRERAHEPCTKACVGIRRPIRFALIFDVMFARFRPLHGKRHYRRISSGSQSFPIANTATMCT
jgi:hypothetical protein